jgi:hypothetical protein
MIDDDFPTDALRWLQWKYPNVTFSNVEPTHVDDVTDDIDYAAAVASTERSRATSAEHAADQLIIGPVIPVSTTLYETGIGVGDIGFVLMTKLVIGHQQVGVKWANINTVTVGGDNDYDTAVIWNPALTNELAAIKSVCQNWLAEHAAYEPAGAKLIVAFLDNLRLTGV